MRKVVLSILIVFGLAFSFNQRVDAQVYNPYFAFYQGVGYMPVATGYYYGQIMNGYPHGEGYIYYCDPYMGWVSYHGGFNFGVCHGQGELLCYAGYIAGVWTEECLYSRLT